VTTVLFTMFAFGWLILPLVLFGLDSTLDPGTLALYPLRLRPLAVGLIAASATGAWPLANLVGLLGVTVGLAGGVLGVPIALVAVVLQVLFCIVLARFVTTSLAGLLRSRRGKDLAGLLILPIFALYEAFVQVVPRMSAEGKITASSFGGIDAWMRWTPPGLAAHAIRDASTGHPLTALLRLLLLAAIILALGALWIRQLARALVTVDTTTQAASVKSNGLPFASRGLLGTIAARAWAYQRREPQSVQRGPALPGGETAGQPDAEGDRGLRDAHARGRVRQPRGHAAADGADDHRGAGHGSSARGRPHRDAAGRGCGVRPRDRHARRADLGQARREPDPGAHPDRAAQPALADRPRGRDPHRIAAPTCVATGVWRQRFGFWHAATRECPRHDRGRPRSADWYELTMRADGRDWPCGAGAPCACWSSWT